MYDRAPPYFSVAVRDHLNTVSPNQWIGRGTHIVWTSIDLTPLDFTYGITSKPWCIQVRFIFGLHCDEIRNSPGLAWWLEKWLNLHECIRLHGYVESTYESFNELFRIISFSKSLKALVGSRSNWKPGVALLRFLIWHSVILFVVLFLVMNALH